MFTSPWQKPFRGMQINKAHPLAKGLVGCWVMNEATGDKVFDLSGNGNNGIITGSDWVADGLDFGATGDNTKYISISASQIINLPTNDEFSIVIDATPNYDADATSAFVAWGGTDDLIYYPNDSSAGSGGTRVYWRDVGINHINYAGANLNGIRTQYSYTSLQSNQIGYQDGIQIGSSNLSTSGAGPFSSFRIGNWADGAQAFGGGIHFVYLYNRVLSPEDVAWLNREPYAMFVHLISPASLYYEAGAPTLGIPIAMYHYQHH